MQGSNYLWSVILATQSSSTASDVLDCELADDLAQLEALSHTYRVAPLLRQSSNRQQQRALPMRQGIASGHLPKVSSLKSILPNRNMTHWQNSQRKPLKNALDSPVTFLSAPVQKQMQSRSASFSGPTTVSYQNNRSNPSLEMSTQSPPRLSNSNQIRISSAKSGQRLSLSLPLNSSFKETEQRVWPSDTQAICRESQAMLKADIKPPPTGAPTSSTPVPLSRPNETDRLKVTLSAAQLFGEPRAPVQNTTISSNNDPNILLQQYLDHSSVPSGWQTKQDIVTLVHALTVPPPILQSPWRQEQHNVHSGKYMNPIKSIYADPFSSPLYQKIEPLLQKIQSQWQMIPQAAYLSRMKREDPPNAAQARGRRMFSTVASRKIVKSPRKSSQTSKRKQVVEEEEEDNDVSPSRPQQQQQTQTQSSLRPLPVLPGIAQQKGDKIG